MTAYITHLTQVNDIQPVFTREAVQAADGSPLCAAGLPFDETLAAQLRGRELARGIEHYVRLEDGFNEELLLSLFLQAVEDDTSLQLIHQSRDLTDKLAACVRAFCDYPVLPQRLNVLAIQLPLVFDQAMFCAWMAMSVYAHLNYPQATLNDAFIAALSHDLGLLDVQPDIVFKSEGLSATEWQALQQHPLFSARLLQSQCKGLDKEILRAVAEHHESPDGTGYPRGKFDKQLCDLGKLLYILDAVNAIYRKHFLPRGRSLNDVMPILQITTLSNSGLLGDALFKLLRQAPPTEHCAIAEPLMPGAIAIIKSNAQAIEHFVAETKEFSDKVGFKHRELPLMTLQNIAKLIRTSLSSCGIINEAYLRWLDQVEKEKLHFAYRELEDVLLMTQEFKFHIQRFNRQIELYLSQNGNSEHASQVQSLRKRLAEKPFAAQAPEALDAYLKGANP